MLRIRNKNKLATYKARCAYIVLKYSLKSPVLQSSKGVHGESAHTGLIAGAIELNTDEQNSLYQLKILSEF